jgi:multidrug efflux pump subunit AcrB
MSFVVLFSLSGLAYWQLPVSLLPAIEVPQIIIKVNYPNASPAQMEQNVLRPIRESLLTLYKLKNVESEASAETGKIELRFEFGAPMHLAYIEVNEKIDRLLAQLPRELPRPQVIRINTADVPIVRLQVIPKNENNFVEISELADKVLRKRLEALAGISLVDLNGQQRNQISIRPDYVQMQALGVGEAEILQTLQTSNRDLGSLSVKDGQYQYFVKINRQLTDIESIKQLSVVGSEGKLVPLKALAQVDYEPSKPQGFHLFNQQSALVVTIHKQAQAKLPKLMPLLYQTIETFKKEYPQVDFRLTQDQSFILDTAIFNLELDLLLGGILAFLVVLLFLGSWRISFLIGLILPSSLVLSFLGFYVFGISFNIISLSGLTLGLGMTIDNAIIIFDNIGRYRSQQMPIFAACVRGTREMIPPLLSSAITTGGIFLPLIFLSGLAGALSYDQAVAVGAILAASLLVSFLLLPLLYLLFFQNQINFTPKENWIYRQLEKLYQKSHHWTFRNRHIVFPIMLIISVLSPLSFYLLDIEALPQLVKNDSLFKINWNEPIEVYENRRRIEQLLQNFRDKYALSETDLGIGQFLLQNEENSLQTAQVYLQFANPTQKTKIEQLIYQNLRQNYPQAQIELLDAPNTFDLLFQNKLPYWEARFQNQIPLNPIPLTQIDSTFRVVQQNFKDFSFQTNQTQVSETQAILEINLSELAHYQVNKDKLLNTLENALGSTLLTEVKSFGENIPIRLSENQIDFNTRIANLMIRNDSGYVYPIRQFVNTKFDLNYKKLWADKTGIYHSIALSKQIPTPELQNYIKQMSLSNGFSVSFQGQLYENQYLALQISIILWVSVLLLYFVLAVEFESLIQPVIVLLTLPLGFAGSFGLLWLSGNSLNIMSGIGLVVMLGIIDNETILKIDTYNRLRKTLPLEEAILQGSATCFKPVLMTSLTNILALLPILISSGLGADLQIPFAIAIIGGLSIGTFMALYFVPLAYYTLKAYRPSRV